jgi:hypothetical protein
VITAATSCRPVATAQGKRWLKAARRRLDAQRVQEARPIPQPRPARVREANRRLEEELATEVRANADYEAYGALGRMKNSRRFGAPPKPYTPPDRPAGRINVTDPDSCTLKTPRGFLQGYNAESPTSSRLSSPPGWRSARRTSRCRRG